MDIVKMQESLNGAAEMWRLAGNAIVHLEATRDASALNLCVLQLSELVSLLSAARNELVHGIRLGRIYEEESQLLLELFVHTAELMSRFQHAASRVSALDKLLVLNRMASA